MVLTNGRVFFISILVGIVGVVSYAWYVNPNRLEKQIHEIEPSEIFLSDQLRESDFRGLQRMRIETIVDMRPDGESADQIPSRKAAELSKQYGIGFEYIPVP